MSTFNQLNGNILDFWELAKGQAPELSRFALHLYGICVNSASVERLWSTMGFLHSKRRNRLHVSKNIKIVDHFVNDRYFTYNAFIYLLFQIY